MKRQRTAVVCALIMVCVGISRAETLTIYDIQYTMDPNGDSPLWHPADPCIVDCSGGIVIHYFNGGAPWVILYDPNYADGWGAVKVKDFTSSKELFSSVSLGDWVSVQNTLVEESEGNTQLDYDDSSSFSVLSSGHQMPDPLIISPNDLPAPIEGPENEWYVTDHRSEKYEAMLVQMRNVVIADVNDVNLGKAEDNYVLTDATDPNHSSWVADYTNLDKAPKPILYHEYVEPGIFYCDVTGIVEQYDSGDYDYYQLLTRKTADIRPELEADLTGDCAVDFADLAFMTQYWLRGKE